MSSTCSKHPVDGLLELGKEGKKLTWSLVRCVALHRWSRQHFEGRSVLNSTQQSPVYGVLLQNFTSGWNSAIAFAAIQNLNRSSTITNYSLSNARKLLHRRKSISMLSVSDTQLPTTRHQVIKIHYAVHLLCFTTTLIHIYNFIFTCGLNSETCGKNIREILYSCSCRLQFLWINKSDADSNILWGASECDTSSNHSHRMESWCYTS